VLIDDGTYYPLTEGDGRTVYDCSTPGGNHGSIVNGTLSVIWQNRTDAVRDHCVEYGGRTDTNVFIPGLLDGSGAADGNPLEQLPKQFGNPHSRLNFDAWSAPELGAINYPALSPPGELLRTTAPIETKFRSEQNATTPFADGDNRLFTTPDTLTGQDLTDAVAYINRTAAAPGEGAGSSAGAATVSGVGQDLTPPPSAGDGQSDGVATVAGVGAVLFSAVGSSAGTATATATGAAGFAVGNSAGVATATAISQAAKEAAGASAGSAFASATNNPGIATGSSDGAATVTAVGQELLLVVGRSDGLATVSGQMIAFAQSVGLSQGQATVIGVQDTVPADMISVRDATLTPGRGSGTLTAGTASATLNTF
jgi:hypothetical protein